MKQLRGAKRSSRKRAYGALIFSSTTFIASAALAASASAAAIVLATLSSSVTTSGSTVAWLQPVVSAVTLSTVAASTSGAATADKLQTVRITPAGEPAAPQAPSGDIGTARRMTLGINLIDPTTYYNGRHFMNLVALSAWGLRTYKTNETMPADRKDADGNVIKLNSGEYANLVIMQPTKAFRGVSVDVACRWIGTGTAAAWGAPVKNQKVSRNVLTFTFVPDANKVANIQFSKIDGGDPIRNVDCREADADRNAVFDPTFLANLSRFSTVRFIKWQSAVEANTTVRWATRTSAAKGKVKGSDGIALEYMVMLANQAKVNPWFNMPWNADDEYIRKFAEYVRDNLDPKLVVYVETSNEVWNYMYKVTTQARDEGVAEGLYPSDSNMAMLKRYAEKTGQVMDIWSSVFAGKMNRLVRVASSQNAVTFGSKQVLGFRDTAKKIDALATAPYFNLTIKAGAVTPATIDQFFTKTVMPKVDSTLDVAKDQKALAQKYGLRYLTYEGGQHFIASTDVNMLKMIERDPRMAKAYTRYLTRWQKEFGDQLILFADIAPVNQYGAWGLQEYIGQPLSEAPKAQAVELFRQSFVAK